MEKCWVKRVSVHVNEVSTRYYLFIYSGGGCLRQDLSSAWHSEKVADVWKLSIQIIILMCCCFVLFVSLLLLSGYYIYIYCLITITLHNADYKTQHYLIVLIQLAWLALEGFTENRSIILVFVLPGFWFRARDQTGALTPYVPFTFQPSEQHKAKLQTRRSLPVL